MRQILLLFLMVTMISCNEPSSEKPEWQTLFGRDQGIALKRDPVYRARIPKNWNRIDPPLEISILDTKMPICTFTIDEVEITVHNFPYDRFEERIAPEAQVARWQRQLEDRDLGSELTIAYGHGGFSGLRFEGVGTFEGKEQMIIGYAQQLAQEHFQILLHPPLTTKKRQQRADYTIKVKGPVENVQQQRADIELFARSFELIEEVPQR